VLLAKSSRVTQRLEALGLKVLVLEPKNHADVQRVLDKLDEVLGTHEAPRVWRVIDASVSAAAQSVPRAARAMRVYFEVNSGAVCGRRNVLHRRDADAPGRAQHRAGIARPLSQAQPGVRGARQSRPDHGGRAQRAGLEQRPGWAGIRAVREARICRFTAAESDVLVRPGPRMGEAARLMAKCLADKAP
jgi:iron complex transport system substrate-binding protein